MIHATYQITLVVVFYSFDLEFPVEIIAFYLYKDCNKNSQNYIDFR